MNRYELLEGNFELIRNVLEKAKEIFETGDDYTRLSEIGHSLTVNYTECSEEYQIKFNKLCKIDEELAKYFLIFSSGYQEGFEAGYDSNTLIKKI